MGGLRSAAAIVLGLALVGSMGGAWAPGPAAPASEGGAPRAAATHHVHMSGFAFDPRDLDVAEGDTVEWHNHDVSTHTATDDGGAWDTGDVPNGQVRSVTFGGGAAYAYTCLYHGFMTGTLDVGGGGGNQAPTVAFTGPAEGATVQGTATVEGTAMDPDGAVAQVEVRVDGGAWQPASGTTSWTFAWDTTAHADGIHTLEARATDDAGATAEATRGVTVANPPTVAITAPADGASVQGVVTVQGTAADPGPGGAVDQVEVRLDGGAWQLAAGSTAWSLAWDTRPGANGAHTVEARSTDAGGLVSSVVLHAVTVDNPADEPPTVAFTAPAEGATVQGAVTVEGTASDPEDALASVEVRVDGGAWQAATGTTSWTFAWDTAAHADGIHTLEARATDAAGKTALASRGIQVANPPRVAFTGPAAGATLAGHATIAGTAADPTPGGGIAKVEVRIAGGPWQPASGTASWSLAWDTRGTADGAVLLEARATDVDGHAGAASRSVEVANPPTVAIAAPAEGEEVEGTVTIAGTAADPTLGGGVARVEVRIDGGAWRLASGGEAWAHDWASREVADGPHTLEARSTDVAGLVSGVAAVRVVTDNFKPDLVIPAIAAPGTLFGSNVTATVRNDGDEAAGAFDVRLEYLGPQGPKVLGTVRVPGLGIGASATVHVAWNTLGKFGNFTLFATADPGGEVEEHREDNNLGQGWACVPATLDLGCRVPVPRIEVV